MNQDQTCHALVELETAGVVMQPGQQTPQRNTRLAVVARNALKGILSDETVVNLEKQTDESKLGLADLRQCLSRHILLNEFVWGLGTCRTYRT